MNLRAHVSYTHACIIARTYTTGKPVLHNGAAALTCVCAKMNAANQTRTGRTHVSTSSKTTNPNTGRARTSSCGIGDAGIGSPAEMALNLLGKWRDDHASLLTDSQMCSAPEEVRQHLLLFFTKHIVQAGLEGTHGDALNFDECEVVAKHLAPKLCAGSARGLSGWQLVAETASQLEQDLLVPELVAEWKAALLPAARQAVLHGNKRIASVTLVLTQRLDMEQPAPNFSDKVCKIYCNGDAWKLCHSSKSGDSNLGACFGSKLAQDAFRVECTQLGFKCVKFYMPDPNHGPYLKCVAHTDARVQKIVVTLWLIRGKYS